MANYFLIIGVGGAGRGVCNHLKYELEQAHGSLEAARTLVLVIDGPVQSDQYALPGGFEIDTNPNSPEFIQCRAAASPEPQIRAVAGGNIQPNTATAYIARWLPRQEAAKIPPPINPEAGFGGHRPAGHAYVYTDITRLRQSLELAYNRIKQLQGAQSQQGSRVIGVIIGSQSGGTGAGMLWDITAMLRQWTKAKLDSLYLIVPLANSYHTLATSEARKLEMNAKNYAGLLNLVRFLAVHSPDFPVAFEYSAHDIFYDDANMVECPFLLDGDGVSCKLNDVVPSLGVVPATADWLLTLIKDDLAGTNHIAASDSINWPNYIGTDPYQMFASFGTSSIRYPWKEVLHTFKHRFAWAVCEAMRQPSGEGHKHAKQVLGGSSFGVMIENRFVDLAPKNWKTLRDQLKTHGRSKNKNRALPVHEPPSQVVKVKTLGILKRDDDEVIRDADTHCNATVKNVSNWASHQHSIIVADFQTDVEQVITDLFMEKVTDPTGRERYQLRLLGKSHRNSITVARDYLDYLRQKMDGLSQVVRQEFDTQFYPAGPNQPSLIAQLQARVQDKIRAMQASPGNQTEEQEDYLRAMDQWLDAEVWYTLVQALQRTLTDAQAIVEGLWDTIGDSAQGWCFTLDSARDALAKSYTQDESRRLAWTQMRLRTYLPTPGAEAEDALFAQIAEPHIDSFFDQACWHIAINPMQKGVERYELVFEYPGIGKKERDIVRRRTVLGQQLHVSHFNSDNVVVWAEAQLKQPLQSKTIWDIMNLDFQSDWLPKKGRAVETLSAADRASFQQQYVSEHINRLVNQSSPLWTLSGHNFQTKQVWGTWGSFVMAETPTSIAEYFSADLQKRGEPLHQTNALPHEIRRAAGYFRAPLTAWSYHATCYSHYLAYLQNPGVLVDIYPHEQNAHRIRQWIQTYIDPAMYELLDVTVTALLNDWAYKDPSDLAFRAPELEVFRLFALCYTMGLIPKRAGVSVTTGEVYYLGHTELANVRDMDALSFKILCTHFRDPAGVWHPNEAVHQELRKLWRDHETSMSNSPNLTGWLGDLKQRADQLQLPVLSGHPLLIHREHLTKAMQAVVYHYIEEVKAAKQLPSVEFRGGREK